MLCCLCCYLILYCCDVVCVVFTQLCFVFDMIVRCGDICGVLIFVTFVGIIVVCFLLICLPMNCVVGGFTCALI